MEALALANCPLPRRLRVGVYADGPLQPRWVVEAFDKLARSDFADVRLVEVRPGPEAPPRWQPLWSVYGAIDRRLFGADPSDRVDIGTVLKPGPERDLDVAFALGELDDSALDGRARCGVWRFCFGEDGAETESMAGVREVAREQPLTASGLKVRLGPGSPPRLVYQSWSRTYPFSVARNRDQLLRKTAEFACRALRELHRGGDAWLQACKPFAGEPLVGAPRTSDVLRIGSRLLRRGAEKALSVEQWFLAFSFNERHAARSIPPDLAGFTRLVPPKDRDWADPFVLEKHGRHYVFFEEVPFATRKGHIAMIEIDRSGRCSAPVTVLARDYHLSYPFVFEHEGNLYMIPESAKNRSVELYRCVDFPRAWKLERKLLDGVRCVDATLHRAADRWWMFANCAAGESRMFDDELCLFSADRLSGDWRPHPKNPVKSDARCSRPAGRLVERDGKLYRPAQVCVPLYGSGLSINRVLKITPQEYVERQVERILPAPASGLLGLHTINQAGDLTVVDAFMRRRRL
jgi:hypothetical protein